MLVIYRKGLRQIHILRVNVNLKFLKRMLSVAYIPANDSVLGKRQDKAVRQVLSTKTSKRKRERRTSLCIVHKCAVPKLSSSSKLIAYISHISVNLTVRTVRVAMMFFQKYMAKAHIISYILLLKTES